MQWTQSCSQFSQWGKQKTAGWEYTVYSSLKKGEGGRIGRSLFVNPKGSWAQPKSQSGFGSQAVPDLQGCAVLALLGEGSKAGPMQRWTMLRGGFLFTLPNFQTLFLCKEAVVCVLCTTWAGTGCCDTMPGASGQLFVRKKRVFTSIA